MSLTRSLLRSALLPVLWPPTAQRPRSGGGPAPGEWVPVQQMPGWDIQYFSPLGQGIVDDGSKWIGTDHAITGPDESLYLLAAGLKAPGPEPVQIRFRIPVFVDTLEVAGVDQLLATNLSIDAAVGSAFHPNPDPPTSSFAGQPFEHTLTPSPEGGQQASSAVSLRITPSWPTTGGMAEETVINYELRLEIQDTEGNWQNVQDAPGDLYFQYGALTDTGTTYQAVNVQADQPNNGFVEMIYTELDVERETIPMRATFLSFSMTPDPDDPGTMGNPAEISFRDGFGNFAGSTTFTGQDFWPPTDFPGSPFTVDQPATVVPFEPPTGYTIAAQLIEAAFANSDLTGQVVNFEIAIEVQAP